MPRLKLGPIPDDKPIKVTLELPPACTATSLPMPRCWPGRPDNQPPIESG